jgi:hypothetical protein
MCFELCTATPFCPGNGNLTVLTVACKRWCLMVCLVANFSEKESYEKGFLRNIFVFYDLRCYDCQCNSCMVWQWTLEVD